MKQLKEMNQKLNILFRKIKFKKKFLEKSFDKKIINIVI